MNSLGATLAAATRIVRRHPAESICAVLLLVMAINLLSQAARKTITNDEVVHIPPGYGYLTSRDFRLNPEHPPLVKILAAEPLLLLKLEPAAATGTVNQDWGERTLSTSMDFWRANRNQYKAIKFWARVPMVILTLALGILIFTFGRQLFGARAAVFAVALFTLEPTMLGHGWIVHTDVPAAFGFLLFFAGLYWFCRAPSAKSTVWLGFVAGLALLTKFSLIMIVPVFLCGLAYMIWRAPGSGMSRGRAVVNSGIAILVVIVSLNAAYFFQHPNLGPQDAAFINGTLPQFAGRALSAFKALSIVFPTYYVFGVYAVFVHNAMGHPASLLGNYSTRGWWYYFPVAFAFKTTVPFLLLSLSALAWSIWRGFVKRERKFMWLLLPAMLYLGVSMTSHINIGIRHIAPVFPFLFLLGGVALDRLLRTGRRPKLSRMLVIGLLGWMLIEGVWANPNYMSFTNQLTLGRPGWQVLSDSNVEWGQDVGALAKYLHQQGETKVCGALSGGWATLEMYGIQLVDFAPADVNLSPTRYVAIGAGFLNGSTVPPGLKGANGEVLSEEQRRHLFAAYRSAVPEAVFGNSIYLYRAR